MKVVKSAMEVKGVAGNRNNSQLKGDPRCLSVSIENNFGKYLLVNYASHPTIYKENFKKISSDFIGVLDREAKKECYDFCMFINGSAGIFQHVSILKHLMLKKLSDSVLSCINK